MIKNITIVCITFLLLGCTRPSDSLFTILDEEHTKITFSNDLEDTGELNILDYLYFYNGGGVAVGDINNDGLTDIFFTGNRVKNQLYLNKGNMVFEEITQTAGVEGNSDWNSGTVMADVNGDGLLDIYVCAVVGVHGFRGHNELFINNGDGTFTEKAKSYGLDFQNYGTMAGFFDYDLDGDLDMYLLNHAVHNAESFGKAAVRYDRTEKSGDRLLRNDGNVFVDVSDQAGIFGGANGYGLGLAIADFDLDGYPDIYISNDFHEDDYFYRNQGDGTFEESGKLYFGHFSKFSMGSDVADINHDGYPELITLDMLPDNEAVLKNSAGEDDQSNLNQRTQVLGYHPQYARNMLHINREGNFFSEVGLMGNIAATDWSWSALFADFDLDAEQDLFITNGIPKRPNDLDYINFISNDEIKRKLNSTKSIDIEALQNMPDGIVQNKFFKGNGKGHFVDRSLVWGGPNAFVSNGAALADFDNDGDMDIVTNNLNQEASLYRNNTDIENRFLKLKFQLNSKNTKGLGTKVAIYSNGKMQFKELHTARGFQSASEPVVHFGLGRIAKLDSLILQWPGGSKEVHYDIAANQTLTFSPGVTGSNGPIFLTGKTQAPVIFESVDLGLDYHHQENKYIDFNRQKLIPFKISRRGPALAVGDLNGDGRDDLFLGGSKHLPSRVYVQREDAFLEWDLPLMTNDRSSEDEGAAIADFNGDGHMDLFVGSGGGEYTGESKALLDRLYLSEDKDFNKAKLPEHYVNTSIIAPNDFDGDGDLDVFVGVSAVASDYGRLPSSFLLRNQEGEFSAEEIDVLKNIGMVTAALWTDFDGDQIKDLIVVGEWMSPTFLKNDGETLLDVTQEKLQSKFTGLWKTLHPFDVDGDSDMDYLLGNWGLNSKFTASNSFPLRMYYGDFDHNSYSETIVAVAKDGSYFPINGLEQLSGQLVTLMKKKYPDFKSFGGKTMSEIFGDDILKQGRLLEVNTLASGILRNEGGYFRFEPFASDLQQAPINCFLSFDFNFDGKQEVLAAGNFFGSEPFHGRFDAFPGALIYDDKNVVLGPSVGLNFANKVVNDLEVIRMGQQTYLIVGVNNGMVESYRINIPDNPMDRL